MIDTVSNPGFEAFKRACDHRVRKDVTVEEMKDSNKYLIRYRNNVDIARISTTSVASDSSEGYFLSRSKFKDLVDISRTERFDGARYIKYFHQDKTLLMWILSETESYKNMKKEDLNWLGSIYLRTKNAYKCRLNF